MYSVCKPTNRKCDVKGGGEGQKVNVIVTSISAKVV